MKKLLTILMIGFLVSTMSLMPLKAAASFDSLVSYGEGDNIYGNCQGKNVVLNENLKGIMVSNSSQLFFIGNDDFKIDVGNPVKNFEVIGDVDNDGYKDVAVYLDVDDGYDDFKIISSKTSKELYASKYLYKEINDNGETIDKNAVIRQIVYDDNIVYLIYNYHLVAIDVKDFKVIFDYGDKDNIWKMAVLDDYVFYTNQLGQLGCLNKKSGELNYAVTLSEAIEVTSKSYNQTGKINLNTWDILKAGNQLYVTSEDAKLHQVNLEDGKVIKSISFDDEIMQKLAKMLPENNNWSSQLIPTGIHNYNFMSYQMSLLDNDLMLVKAYLGNAQNELINDKIEKKAPHLIIVDLKNWKIKLDIAIDQYNLDCSEVVMTSYNNAPALLVPTYTTDNKLRLVAYDLNDGTVLKQTNLNIMGLAKNNQKVVLTSLDNSYLLQVFDGSTVIIDQNLKITSYLGRRETVNWLRDVSDGTLVSGYHNEKITQIKKLGLNGKTDQLVVFDLPGNYPNNGFEAINYEEKYNHILSLVNETNTNGEVVASHIVIMDINTNSVLCDKKVLLDKGYDENKKYYEHYLRGETIKYFSDLNNDGKLELLVDDNIIDGATFTDKGAYMPTFEGAATIIDIGDLNNDGISDLVNVGESEMRVYYSQKNGYDISYQKTNIVKNYDKKLQNNQYVQVLGDLDHDGIKDFVINGYNDKGCQYYQVINARDLSLRYPLLKDGVIFEGEEDNFTISNKDFNNDGVDDLIYSVCSEQKMVLNGATGEKLFEFATYDYDNNWSNDNNAVPLETLVAFKLAEDDGDITKINDINDDGIEELAYVVTEYDQSSHGERKILKILDGSSYKEIKSKLLGKGYFETGELINVSGQDKLIYHDGTLSQIYDYRNDGLVAGLKIKITKAKGLQNGQLQIVDNLGQVYSFSDQRDFKLVDFDAKKISDGNLKINYQTEKNGLMAVYDQGNLVKKTTAKNFTIKLLEGKHDLTLSYNDGHGKTTHYSTTVVVEKSRVSRYLMLLLTMMFVVGGIALVFYPKYRLMKKAGVKRG